MSLCFDIYGNGAAGRRKISFVQAIKWYIVTQVELTREERDGEIRAVVPYFRSVRYALISEDSFESHDLNQALKKLNTGLEKYFHEF